MPQQTRTREQTQIQYAASSQVMSQQLGLGMQYREIALTLEGAMKTNTTNTVNTYSTTSVLGGDEWRTITRLDLLINGGDVIQTFTGEELSMWQNVFFNRPRNISTGFAASNATSASFASTCIIPFWDPKGRNPIDTLLDSGRLSDFRIQVTWGTADSVTSFTGNTFTTNPTLTVTSRECFGLTGPDGKPPRFSVARRFRQLNPAAVSAQTGYKMYLPVGNIYKGFLINTKDASGNDLADCIDRVQLGSGTTIFVDSKFSTLRNWWNLRNDTMGGVFGDTTYSQIPLAYSTKTLVGGWTYIDLLDDGYVTEAIDTYSMSELWLSFNTNQTITTLAVLPNQVIPIRG